MSSKIQTADTDKFPQAADANAPTKVKDGIQENQAREKRSTTENIEAGIRAIADVVSAVTNDDFSQETTGNVVAPRNVVLLLIDDKDHNEKREENLRQDRAETLPFTIEGSLQVYFVVQV